MPAIRVESGYVEPIGLGRTAPLGYRAAAAWWAEQRIGPGRTRQLARCHGGHRRIVRQRLPVRRRRTGARQRVLAPSPARTSVPYPKVARPSDAQVISHRSRWPRTLLMRKRGRETVAATGKICDDLCYCLAKGSLLLRVSRSQSRQNDARMSRVGIGHAPISHGYPSCSAAARPPSRMPVESCCKSDQWAILGIVRTGRMVPSSRVGRWMSRRKRHHRRQDQPMMRRHGLPSPAGYLIEQRSVTCRVCPAARVNCVDAQTDAECSDAGRIASAV